MGSPVNPGPTLDTTKKQWTWTCPGINGGKNSAVCTIHNTSLDPVVGVCGPVNNLKMANLDGIIDAYCQMGSPVAPGPTLELNKKEMDVDLPGN